MAKDNFNGLVGTVLMENGRKVRCMDKESNCGHQVTLMMENGFRIKEKVKECLRAMEMSKLSINILDTRDNGKIIKEKVEGYLSNKNVHMMVNGKMIKKKVEEYKEIRMMMYMMGHLLIT